MVEFMKFKGINIGVRAVARYNYGLISFSAFNRKEGHIDHESGIIIIHAASGASQPLITEIGCTLKEYELFEVAISSCFNTIVIV